MQLREANAQMALPMIGTKQVALGEFKRNDIE
jgi:hypothetical protein